jgi:hypothetical protein
VREPTLNETREPIISQKPAKKGKKRLRYVGIALLVASAVLWTAVLAVPFLPVAMGWKVGIGSVVVVVAEVAFWISALILGREVVSRYRRYLDPRTWGQSRETYKPPPSSSRPDEHGPEKPDA